MRDTTAASQGILQVIESSETTSSSGIDRINDEMLKNTKDIPSVILSHICQQSLLSESFLMAGKWVRLWRYENQVPLITGPYP